MQRHANQMLYMRRTMKMVADCMRLELSVFGLGYWRQQ